MNHVPRVLIVDDDEDMLEIERVMLDDRGFSVSTVGTVELALKAISEKFPDVVLLDLVYPENASYGRDAAIFIRDAHPKIPIFLVTSLTREYLSQAIADTSHYDELLSKPIDFDHLAVLIKKYTKSE